MKSPSQRIEELKQAKPHFDYSEFVYTTYHNKSIVICPIPDHGRFNISFSKAISKDIIGCPECAKISHKSKMSKSNDVFKNQVIALFPEYDVSRVVYKHSDEYVELGCPKHGFFLISPRSILFGQHGCQNCGTEDRIKNGVNGWTKKDYIKVVNGKPVNLYIIKCYNDTECFYKIGITSKLVHERFIKCRMPYDFDIVCINTTDSETAWMLEKELHKKLKAFKYKPSIKFNGYTECFTEEIYNFLNKQGDIYDLHFYKNI